MQPQTPNNTIEERIYTLAKEIKGLKTKYDEVMLVYTKVEVSFRNIPRPESQNFIYYVEDTETYVAIKDIMIKHIESKIESKKEEIKRLAKSL